MDQVAYTAAAITDRGLKRKENQDNFFVSKDEHLFVVADGMLKEGVRASRLTVETLEAMWINSRPELSDSEAVHDWLKQSIERANQAVLNAVGDAGTEGLSSVVVAVQSSDNRVHIAHLGTCRAYAVKGGGTEALTLDHDMIGEMIRLGKIDKGTPYSCVYRNCLVRHVGMDNVSIDLTEMNAEPNDWLVLCSQGLYCFVAEKKLAEILSTCASAEQAINKLLAEVMDQGAPNNLAMVVVPYERPRD
jgi:serine/threonine protein phosphatase PrpC